MTLISLQYECYLVKKSGIGHNSIPIPPIFIRSIVDTSFVKAVFSCETRCTELNAPINGGRRNSDAIIEKRPKPEIRVVNRFLHPKATLQQKFH